ncbi:MAG: type II 3-dehydroquinate dehydratase [Vicingaceae bacterium]
MRIAIINGPNLNLLGKREPEIYGGQSFNEFLHALKKEFAIEIDYFQSNVEGEIINFLHQTGFDYDGIILNAGAYTHTSIAISDAIAAIKTPVVEVHISNVYQREVFRHQSLLAKNCKGIITGFGLKSYKLAIQSFL